MAHGEKKKRWPSRILSALCALCAAAAALNCLAPALTSRSIIQYTPYQVESRDINTTMSFGGTVEILHSQAVAVSESTAVREVYVSASQAVSKGDKLIQLENGEVLTAATDGVVNQLRVRAGGWAIQGMTLVQICDLTNMQISMNVDEYDITSLSAGQPCTVYLLALEESFEAEISHIDRVSTGGGTVAYYTAGIAMTASATVMPGMQVSVAVPRAAATDVPTLPMEAVSMDGEGSAFVYIAQGEGYEKTPVTLGLNDGMHVEITDGLAVGDTVYLSRATEASEAGFTLEKLYKSVFGETVIINESKRQRGGAQQTGGMPSANSPEAVMPDGSFVGGEPAQARPTDEEAVQQPAKDGYGAADAQPDSSAVKEEEPI